MDLRLRPIAPDEFDTWRSTIALVFGFDPHPDDREVWFESTEFDRTIAAFDGDEMIGTGSALSYRMTVPGGGSVSAAGVTAIAVAPTHRRRGVLTSMMRHQLADVRDRDEPVAILWASESQIYGRYGYGAAIESADLRIARDRLVLRDDLQAPTGSIRVFTDIEEARGKIPSLYEAATTGIPGSLDRNAAGWATYFHDSEHRRRGRSAARYAVYEREGDATGYVAYRQKLEWTDMHPDSTLEVGDLQAVDGDAYIGLWRFLAGIDLVTSIEARTMRVHEPVLSLLREPRRVRRSLGDSIWVRLLDVPAALAARRYGSEGALVIEVVDEFCPGAGGAFRLEGGPDGASCEPTDAEPDLRIDAADLAAGYLGRSRLTDLLWLGRLDGDAEAVNLAHRMFSWPVEAWCTVHF